MIIESTLKPIRAGSFYSKMQRFREGIHIRTMKAKRKVEEISKEDVQSFLKKNAFVLFTVGAVVVGRLRLPLA